MLHHIATYASTKCVEKHDSFNHSNNNDIQSSDKVHVRMTIRMIIIVMLDAIKCISTYIRVESNAY